MEKTTARKSTESARKVRALVKNLYRRAHEAKKEGKKVAYCMVGSLYDEILRAMDIVPVWTENYAGLCAAKRVAEEYLLKAESEGYSNLICGYARTGIGFDALRKELGQIPEGAPDGGMPEPDFLLGSSYICDPRYKWYQALLHYMDTPIYNIDVLVPPVGVDVDEVEEDYINYQVEELRGLISFLEYHTGKKMDYDRLMYIVDLAERTRRKWWEAYELRKNKPCPMPAEDHFNIFVPHHFMLGEEETYRFYEELYNELKEKVDKGIGVVKEEKFRLLWGGGLPPWHSMYIFNYFEEKGAVFVAETAYRPLEPIDVPENIKDPLRIIAYRAYKRFTYRHKKAMENTGNPNVELLLELIKEYDADGVVMHGSLSCRASTIGQIHFKNLIQRYVKIPVMFMESDIVDIRDYSEAETKRKIDDFIETLG